LTDTDGDSGSTAQTNLSALKLKGLEFELLLIRSCQSWSEKLKNHQPEHKLYHGVKYGQMKTNKKKITVIYL